ncbi:MAG: rsmE [Bacteriovoracaceae bacterium]|nr:rsmE [Bacteriovoracaceae bacterium]
MIRLYIDSKFKKGDRLEIPKDEFRYFSSVRRGQGEVILFNRIGEEALGKVSEKFFEIEEVRKIEIPLYNLTVAVALPENAVIPGIIRTVSELGAKELIFFSGKRSQAASRRLTENARFEKTSLESARQCGRGVPLQIKVAKDLLNISPPTNSQVLFFDEASSDKKSLDEKSHSMSSVVAIIGCEGGWSEDERDFAKKSDYHFVHFETPILRVETAATVATFYAIERMRKL